MDGNLLTNDGCHFCMDGGLASLLSGVQYRLLVATGKEKSGERRDLQKGDAGEVIFEHDKPSRQQVMEYAQV